MQKTSYDVRISDWSSDLCSSDLCPRRGRDRKGQARRAQAMRQRRTTPRAPTRRAERRNGSSLGVRHRSSSGLRCDPSSEHAMDVPAQIARYALDPIAATRSEEHTSELQSLMRISYAVFCLKKKKNNTNEVIQV